MSRESKRRQQVEKIIREELLANKRKILREARGANMRRI